MPKYGSLNPYRHKCDSRSFLFCVHTVALSALPSWNMPSGFLRLREIYCHLFLWIWHKHEVAILKGKSPLYFWLTSRRAFKGKAESTWSPRSQIWGLSHSPAVSCCVIFNYLIINFLLIYTHYTQADKENISSLCSENSRRGNQKLHVVKPGHP